MITDVIERKLKKEFSPIFFDLQDESHKHKGHSGWQEGGETHFKLVIASNAFIGQSKIVRHKSIYKILSAELKSHIHALSIQAFTGSEYRKLL
ncbi:MAG: BolA family transcriptional regulator [Alphaproteobacteria bacterium]|nr:BolA family transcriptional regulator [Alphaproteobacteria bacterium]